jgi:AcrR family transcriptional regulator
VTPLPPSSPSRAGERTARSPDSRTAILEAAEALLLDRGVEGVSIRRVSERCGYTAPTIYHHFGDKKGLIDAVLEARFALVLRLMEAIERGSDPAAYLTEMARAFVRFALDNPSFYRLLTVPRLEDEDVVPSAEAARELVKGALEDLAGEGTLATPDIDEAFQVVWCMLHGLISLHLIRPRHELSPHLIERTFEVMRAGLLRSHAGEAHGEAAR